MRIREAGFSPSDCERRHDFERLDGRLLRCVLMFAIAALMTIIHQASGTPYISGGDSPAGTDCSGLALCVSNAATGRPVYGDRFSTANIESALRARGFQHGSAWRLGDRVERSPHGGDVAGSPDDPGNADGAGTSNGAV